MKTQLAIISLCLIFIGSASQAYAETPAEYEVQIVIEDIANIDFEEQTYDAYFWIILTSDDADFTVDPPTLQFPNGVILDYLQESDLTSVSPHKYVSKIMGTFDMDTDFHDYPYEIIETGITMQIYGKTIDEAILKASPEQFELDDIHAPGLVFTDATFDVITTQYLDGNTYSQFITVETWEHPKESIFLQEIFPLFVIAAVAIFILRFQPKNIEHKAGAGVGLIFSLIAFHGLVIEDALPELSYLTFEENLIIVDYAIVIHLLIEVLIQYRFNKDDDVKAKKINNKMIAILPAVIAVVAAGVFLI